MPWKPLPSSATRSTIFSLSLRHKYQKTPYLDSRVTDPPHALNRNFVFLTQKMKKSGLLAASFAAASATAVSVSSSTQISHQDGMGQRGIENSSSASSSSSEKFAPRFDGLRFIETLITAHR